MDSQVHHWFPTTIYQAFDLISDEENSAIRNRCLELYSKIESGGENWICNAFTSLGKYDISQDKIFHPVISKVLEGIQEFSLSLNSDSSYSLTQSWFNICNENSYQEYHEHSNSIFSCIYWVSAPEGSGNTIFATPLNTMISLKNVVKYDFITAETAVYLPKEKSLIAFRSYLKHMVQIGTNKEPRISLSFNFA